MGDMSVPLSVCPSVSLSVKRVRCERDVEVPRPQRDRDIRFFVRGETGTESTEPAKLLKSTSGQMQDGGRRLN